MNENLGFLKEKAGKLSRSPGVYLMKDKTGSIITLNIKDISPHYKVGENTLTQLDLDGNEISGELAENYILRKIK